MGVVRSSLEPGSVDAGDSGDSIHVLATERDEDGWQVVEGRSATSRSRPGGPLDEHAFPNFKPFLAASQEYATFSGCRFRSDSFQSLPEEVSGAESERLAAKLLAAPQVRRFAQRLAAREPELLQEVEFAYRVVMAESVRNAMVAAFRELGIWPPVPAPPGVAEDDCSYEDLTAALPIIAQRVWNDEMRRKLDGLRDSFGGVGKLVRQAVTASYLVDFAHGVGVQLPQEADGQMGQLHAFSVCLREWEEQRRALTDEQTFSRVDPVGPCESASSMNITHEVQDGTGWWSDNMSEAMWTVTGAIVLGAFSTAGFGVVRNAFTEAAQDEDGDATKAAAEEQVARQQQEPAGKE